MSLVSGQEGWRRCDQGRGAGRGESQDGAVEGVVVGGGFGADGGAAEARGRRVRWCFGGAGWEAGGEAGVSWRALRVCVRSASASGSKGAFAFVGGWGCGFGALGSLRATAAGSLLPLSFSLVSVLSFFLRALFGFFGFASAFVAASTPGVAVLPFFLGELLRALSAPGFSFPTPSSLPFAFSFPSSSSFSCNTSTAFSSSCSFCSPTLRGTGDESCKNIPALLDTSFFFPYTLAGFFGGRWVSIVSVVVGRRSVAFFVVRNPGGGVLRKWDGVARVRGCRGNEFAKQANSCI